MRLHSGARPEPLVLKFAGQVPTLPHPLNLKVDANGWRNTDLADGEYCINSADNKVFIRMREEILSFALPIVTRTTGRHELVIPYDYNGRAPYGSLETESVWTITRLTINGAGVVTANDVLTNVKWSNRAILIF